MPPVLLALKSCANLGIELVQISSASKLETINKMVTVVSVFLIFERHAVVIPTACHLEDGATI